MDFLYDLGLFILLALAVAVPLGFFLESCALLSAEVVMGLMPVINKTPFRCGIKGLPFADSHGGIVVVIECVGVFGSFGVKGVSVVPVMLRHFFITLPVVGVRSEFVERTAISRRKWFFEGG